MDLLTSGNDLLYSNNYNPQENADQGYGLTDDLQRFKLREYIERNQNHIELQDAPEEHPQEHTDLMNTNRVVKEDGEPRVINTRRKFREERLVYNIDSMNRDTLYIQAELTDIIKFEEILTDIADLNILPYGCYTLFKSVFNYYSTYKTYAGLKKRDPNDPNLPIFFEMLIPLYGLILAYSNTFYKDNPSFAGTNYDVTDPFYTNATVPVLTSLLTNLLPPSVILLRSKYHIARAFLTAFNPLVFNPDIEIIVTWLNSLLANYPVAPNDTNMDNHLGYVGGLWQPFYAVDDIIYAYTYTSFSLPSRYSYTLKEMFNCKSVRLLSTSIPNTIANITANNNVLLLSLAKRVTLIPEWVAGTVYSENDIVARNGTFFSTAAGSLSVVAPGLGAPEWGATGAAEAVANGYTSFTVPLWDPHETYDERSIVAKSFTATYQPLQALSGFPPLNTAYWTPYTIPSWEATVAYGAGTVVTFSSGVYQALGLTTPGVDPTNGGVWAVYPVTTWDSGANYAVSDVVTYTYYQNYMSVQKSFNLLPGLSRHSDKWVVYRHFGQNLPLLPSNFTENGFNFEVFQLDVGQYTVETLVAHMTARLNAVCAVDRVTANSVLKNLNANVTVQASPTALVFKVDYVSATGKISIRLTGDPTVAFHIKFYSSLLNTKLLPKLNQLEHLTHIGTYTSTKYSSMYTNELWYKLGFPWPCQLDKAGLDVYANEFTNLVTAAHPLLGDENSALNRLNLYKQFARLNQNNFFNRPYRKPDLAVKEIFLVINNFNQLSTKAKENIFAKVILNVPHGQVAYNTFVPGPFIFPKLTDIVTPLDVEWIYEDGSLVDFCGVEHSFVLEFIQYSSRVDVNNYNTRMGYIDNTSYPEFLSGNGP